LGLTQMIGRPVLWNGDSQVTGDVMHLINNLQTNQMDSIKVLNNAFIIEKDTLGTGYNQVKGVNLYGKFRDNKLSELDLVKNAEMIYYAYNEKNEFIGIDKGICSHINVGFSDNEISTVTLFVSPESELYPDEMLPQNARFLKDFLWRGDEKINSLAEIFSDEEIQEEADKKEEREQKQKEAEEPIEIQKETLNPEAEPQQTKEKKTSK